MEYTSIGWYNNCLDGQMIKFSNSQVLDVADRGGQMTIKCGGGHI